MTVEGWNTDPYPRQRGREVSPGRSTQVGPLGPTQRVASRTAEAEGRSRKHELGTQPPPLSATTDPPGRGLQVRFVPHTKRKKLGAARKGRFQKTATSRVGNRFSPPLQRQFITEPSLSGRRGRFCILNSTASSPPSNSTASSPPRSILDSHIL